MRVQDQAVIVGTALGNQALLRGSQCLLLDVKGVHKPVRPDGFGQVCGIVPVSHGKVHGDIPGVQVVADKELVKLKQIYHMQYSSYFSISCGRRCKTAFVRHQAFPPGLPASRACMSERRKRIARSTASLELYHGSSS